MILFWRREKPDTEEGMRARETAEAHLEAARARRSEVRQVTRSLRHLRERNHFGEQLESIFQGGRSR